MKKLALLVLASLLTPLFVATAAQAEAPPPTPAINDEAAIFDDSELSRLNEASANAKERYGLKVILETEAYIKDRAQADLIAHQRARELGVYTEKNKGSLYVLLTRGENTKVFNGRYINKSSEGRHIVFKGGPWLREHADKDFMEGQAKLVEKRLVEEKYYDALTVSIGNIALAYNNGEGNPDAYDYEHEQKMRSYLWLGIGALGLCLLGVATVKDYTRLRSTPDEIE